MVFQPAVHDLLPPSTNHKDTWHQNIPDIPLVGRQQVDRILVKCTTIKEQQNLGTHSCLCGSLHPPTSKSLVSEGTQKVFGSKPEVSFVCTGVSQSCWCLAEMFSCCASVLLKNSMKPLPCECSSEDLENIQLLTHGG